MTPLVPFFSERGKPRSSTWVMGVRPIVVRSSGALLALVLGFVGTRWGAQAMLAAIATLAIAVIAIEQRLETHKG